MRIKVERQSHDGSQAWYVILMINGKTIKKVFKSESEAQTVASALREKIKRNKPHITFKDVAFDWFNLYAKLKNEPSTLKGYESLLRVHIIPAFEDSDITSISKPSIIRFFKGKLDNGLSISRVRHMNAVISNVFNYAIDNDLTDSNPTHGVWRILKRKQDNKKKYDVYTKDELGRYLKAMQTDFSRQFPLFLTLARTGMRSGEAIALQWRDMDFTNNLIHIQRNLPDKGELTTPKSGKDRKVVMSPQLKAVLENHKERMLKEFGNKMPLWAFPNKAGNPYERANLTNRYHLKAIEKAGLKRIRIHDLRHTYATIRLENGDDIVDISRQMGHSSIKITVDTYGHNQLNEQSHKQVALLDDDEWSLDQ